jgi:hypothetical protein
MDNSDSIRFPMLEQILGMTGLQLKPMYTIRDIAAMFKVSARAIQKWVTAGQLVPRALPGRAKFLAQDLEQFLKHSRKGDQR